VPAVKATSRPLADRVGSEAKPGASSLTVVEVCARRSRSTTREAVRPAPPLAGLVTAVKATRCPSGDSRGSYIEVMVPRGARGRPPLASVRAPVCRSQTKTCAVPAPRTAWKARWRPSAASWGL
jgi:hypothetical protein